MGRVFDTSIIIDIAKKNKKSYRVSPEESQNYSILPYNNNEV